jgi:hypothetical protein
MDEKWGYIDESGTYVINPQFEIAENFSENGLALVVMDEKWGYIDEKGNYVIELQFDEAWGFSDNGLAPVKTNKKYGVIDEDGEFVINPQFDGCKGVFDDGYFLFYNINDDYDYEYFLIDKDGDEIFTYSNIPYSNTRETKGLYDFWGY